MAGSFGDGGSVRRLGQALLGAARDLRAVTGDLSGHVQGLVPDGWSGNAADTFRSDWNTKAARARQFAAVCDHVGRVLTGLADQIDGANQQASSAQQMTGGVASRFAGPAAEQKAAQVLSRAAGSAEQARAAARAKLAGIQVPRTGRPLTARQVDAWAQRVAPQSSLPGLDHWLHEAGKPGALAGLIGRWLAGAKGYARRSGLAAAWGWAERPPGSHGGWLYGLGPEAHFTEGLYEGALKMLRGAADLLPGPDGGMGRWLLGDRSAAQSWQELSHQAPVFVPALAAIEPHAAATAWEGFGKGFLDWSEWRTDPARAAGNVVFNAASLVAGPKLLRAGAGAPAAATRDGADAAEGAGAAREGDPGPPPQADLDRLHAEYQQWRLQAEPGGGRPADPVWLRVPLGRGAPGRSALETGEAQQSPAGKLFAGSAVPASRADRLRSAVFEKFDDLNDATTTTGTEASDLWSPRPPAGQAETTVAHPLPEAPPLAVDTPETISAVLTTALLTGDLTRNLYLLLKPELAPATAAARDAAITTTPPLVLSAQASEGSRP